MPFSHPDPEHLRIARSAWGLVLAVLPGVVLRPPGARRNDSRVRIATRLLGARELVEAALLRRRRRGWVALGAAVDATHALSMIVLAVLDRRHRRIALASAAVASILAAEGVAAAASARAPVSAD